MYKINIKNIVGDIKINQGSAFKLVAELYENDGKDLVEIGSDDQLKMIAHNQNFTSIDKTFTLNDDLSTLELLLNNSDTNIDKIKYDLKFYFIKDNQSYIIDNIKYLSIV